MKRVVVSDSFDDIKSPGMRYLHEASRSGALTVVLWPDATIRRVTGSDPKFPIAERKYIIDGIRHVARTVVPSDDYTPGTLPEGVDADVWADLDKNSETREYCERRGIEYRIVSEEERAGFPVEDRPLPEGARSVLVTGCFDWFHSGHVRFFEEVSELGQVYVVVGHDRNVRLLKGEGHPLFPEAERRYICDSFKYVHQAFVSTGEGWMDAEPEVHRLKPDMYAVNEDGDKPEKREFCEVNGIEYVVLKRTPKEGLTRRSSTDLRGY